MCYALVFIIFFGTWLLEYCWCDVRERAGQWWNDEGARIARWLETIIVWKGTKFNYGGVRAASINEELRSGLKYDLMEEACRGCEHKLKTINLLWAKGAGKMYECPQIQLRVGCSPGDNSRLHIKLKFWLAIGEEDIDMELICLTDWCSGRGVQ